MILLFQTNRRYTKISVMVYLKVKPGSQLRSMRGCRRLRVRVLRTQREQTIRQVIDYRTGWRNGSRSHHIPTDIDKIDNTDDIVTVDVPTTVTGAAGGTATLRAVPHLRMQGSQLADSVIASYWRMSGVSHAQVPLTQARLTLPNQVTAAIASRLCWGYPASSYR